MLPEALQLVLSNWNWNHDDGNGSIHLSPETESHAEIDMNVNVNVGTDDSSSFSEEDVAFMRLALSEASTALDVGETPVGCVVVRDGAVIARGHNETNATRNGTRHAEMIAIDEILEADRRAGRQADFSACTLYVSCEPCIMCAGALSILKFRNVVYGCANDKFGGNGSILSIHEGGRGGCGRGRDEAAGGATYPSVGGLMKDEAIRMLQEFYVSGNPAAPKPHRPVRASRAERNTAKRKKADADDQTDGCTDGCTDDCTDDYTDDS